MQTVGLLWNNSKSVIANVVIGPSLLTQDEYLQLLHLEIIGNARSGMLQLDYSTVGWLVTAILY